MEHALGFVNEVVSLVRRSLLEQNQDGQAFDVQQYILKPSHDNSSSEDSASGLSLEEQPQPSELPISMRTHHIIVGLLIVTICLLSIALLVLLVPIAMRYIRRKIPVSKERINRRYDTIERWLVTKRVRKHDYRCSRKVLRDRPYQASSSNENEEKSMFPDTKTEKMATETPLPVYAKSTTPKRSPSRKLHSSADRGKAIKNERTVLFGSGNSSTPSGSEEDAEDSGSASTCSTQVEEDSDRVNEVGHFDLESSAARECPICLEECQENDIVSWSANVACGHVFHHECIKEWLLRRANCPCCREPVLAVDYESSGPFKQKQLEDMVTEWRQRMLTTYYCSEEGLRVLDEDITQWSQLSRDGKDLIYSRVKRQELKQMRRGPAFLCE